MDAFVCLSWHSDNGEIMNMKILTVLFISALGTSAAVAQSPSRASGDANAAGKNEMRIDSGDRSAGAAKASSGKKNKQQSDTAGSSAETISGTSGSSNSGGSRGSTDGGGAGVTTGISGAGIPGNLGTMDGTKGNNSPYIGAGTAGSGSSGASGSDKPPTTGTGIPSAATGGSEKHLFRGQSPEPSKSTK
jgi:hypothetical protein